MSLSLAGDLASIAGLLIAVVGFLVTIREARKARIASEQARSAVNAAVSRIASRLLEDEIGECLTVVQEAMQAVRDGRWIEGSEKCEEIMVRFARLLDHKKLMHNEREAIDLGIFDLQRFTLGLRSRAYQPDALVAGHYCTLSLGSIITLEARNP